MPPFLDITRGHSELGRHLRRATVALFTVCAALFVANVAGRAMVETFAHDDFPEQLAIKVEQMARVGSPEPSAIMRLRQRAGTGGCGRK